ncbi:MAG: acyl-CoA dehydrogenase family protein, partial [Planctomycetota bacterium]
LTEANAGSDAAALRTRAIELPDGSWQLDGRKVWITSGGTADLLTVFARTPPEESDDSPFEQWPISAFLVPSATPGVEPGLPEHKMGLCGSNTVEVGLDGVVVGADALLGARGQGFKLALRILNGGRHGLAACCIGQAKLARDLALAHALEREQFGRPIATFGMVEELLAGIEADIYAMEAATWWAAGSLDRGQTDARLEAACCKIFATERLWDIANQALQVTGGTGFMREYAYERIVRDARINMIFEGTNQVLRMMLVSQGLAGVVRGTAGAPDDEFSLGALDERLAEERAGLEDRARRFALEARAVAERHGTAVRDAQFDQRRLGDMAVALFVEAAVLARLATDLETGLDAEVELGRLALARRAAEFETAAREALQPTDALVAAVAATMRTRGA